MKSHLNQIFVLILFFHCSFCFAQKNKNVIPEIIPQRLEIYDTIWGEVVHDPYRWMENLENDSLISWIKYQNGVNTKYLSKDYNRIYDIIARYNTIYFNPYIKNGKYLFVRMNIEDSKPPVLYYTDNLNKPASFLFDPSTIEKNKTYSIYDFEVSEDDNKLAVQLDRDGSDWKTIMVFDIKRKKWLSDKLTHVKYSNLKWYGDGFFYTRYAETRPEDVFTTQIRGRGLYYHKIGTSQESDKLIYLTHGNDIFDFTVSNLGNYLILIHDEIKDGKTYRALSQKRLPLSDDIEFKRFIYSKESVFLNIIGENEHGLIIHSNLQAKNGAVYIFNPEKLNQASLFIPETSAQIQNAWQFGENFLISYLNDNEYILTKYNYKGEYINGLKLEEGCILDRVTGNQKDSIVIFSFTSFYQAPSIYSLNINSFQAEKIGTTKVGFDHTKFITRKINYYSKDSTIIPMYLTYRKDLDLKKQNPTLLYGYGGFGVPTRPFFNATFVAFMQYGGILAVPQIRGGGDFPGWHKPGQRHRKQNTIDDFIAAAEFLHSNYTSSEKLAIIGGSQGGLLTLSAMVQKPELFKAVVSDVGLSDMIRYHLYNIGYAYEEEYGNSEDSLDFKHLSSYSPLHNLKKGTIYPSTLLLTGINDDRVHPFHSFKMQAALQQINPDSEPPHLMYVGENYGHCNCRVFDNKVEIDAFILNYLFKLLEMEANLKKYWLD